MVVNKKHDCTLLLGSQSMLAKADGRWSRAVRQARKLLLTSQHHPHTAHFFRSYPSLVAERQRQVLSAPNVIHPCSLFSLAWKSIMMVVNLAHMVTSSMRLCFVLEERGNPRLRPIDLALLSLHVVCHIDIMVRFDLGLVQHGCEIVMERRRIACHYLKRHFLVDLLSSLPLAYIFLCCRVTNMKWLFCAHLLPLLRTVKICTVMIDIKTLLQVLVSCPQRRRALRQLTLFLLVLHAFVCLIYSAPIFRYYWFGEEALAHNKYLYTDNIPITEFAVSERYEKAMFVCISAFIGTGFSFFSVNQMEEVVINSVIIIAASVFQIYTTVFVLKIYMNMYNSSIRYYELTDQVENYMRHKQFPSPLKKRLLKFYRYRYQERYFKEEDVLNCLSDQLRNRVLLHLCQQLLAAAGVLRGAPASLVGAVVGCARSEVYLPNDLVLQAGDVGHCMYFIASGTVAVYSLKGVEICHMQDGAHFGEVELLQMQDSKRVATVIAIETTRLFRLDGADFRRYIMTDVNLMSRMEALASQRMHENVLIDEAHRKAFEKKDEDPNLN